MRQQIMTLTEQIKRLTKELPLHELIYSQNVRPELRWQKTQNWRNVANVKESKQIEVTVEGVGKMLVLCEYIAASDIKSDILKN